MTSARYEVESGSGVTGGFLNAAVADQTREQPDGGNLRRLVRIVVWSRHRRDPGCRS